MKAEIEGIKLDLVILNNQLQTRKKSKELNFKSIKEENKKLREIINSSICKITTIYQLFSNVWISVSRLSRLESLFYDTFNLVVSDFCLVSGVSQYHFASEIQNYIRFTFKVVNAVILIYYYSAQIIENVKIYWRVLAHRKKNSRSCTTTTAIVN